jgi:hypothetical protein
MNKVDSSARTLTSSTLMAWPNQRVSAWYTTVRARLAATAPPGANTRRLTPQPKSGRLMRSPGAVSSTCMTSCSMCRSKLGSCATRARDTSSANG